LPNSDFPNFLPLWNNEIFKSISTSFKSKTLNQKDSEDNIR